MKKLLLSLTAMALGFSAYAQTWNSAQSDFNTFNEGKASTSYNEYSTSGGWSVVNAAILSGDTYDFIGAGNLAPTLNGGKVEANGQGSLTSPALTGGLGTLKFNYGFAYSDSSVTFTVNIKQNGTVVRTDTQNLTGLAKDTAYEYELNVDIAGDFVIEVLNVGGTSNSNTKRVSIWNLQWTDCAVAKSNPELAYSEEAVTVEGLDGAFTAPTLSYKTDGTISYSSSNTAVATVNAQGVVSIVNYGSAIITAASEATETYSAGQAAYTIVVTPGLITVAKALELVEEGLTFNAQVMGYVSKIGTFNSNYGSLTYWIVDNYDAATVDSEPALQVYGGLWKDGAQFSGADALTVGASIVVEGSLKDYNGTPEIDLNSVVVSYDDSNVDSGNNNPGTETPSNPLEGENVTFDFTDLASLTATLDGDPITFNGDEDQYDVANVVFTEGVISITGAAEEEASMSPRLYLGSGSAAGWSYRFYNQNTITIAAAEGYIINGIEFKATNLGNSSITFEGDGTYSSNTWTANDNAEVTEVVISKNASGNNPSISTMTVYYTTSSGVSEIATDVNANGENVIYNLQGVRVNNPAKGGIYIINGKKVLVK